MKEITERFTTSVNTFWRRFQLGAVGIIAMLQVARNEKELFPVWFVEQFPKIQMCCFVAMVTAQLTKKDPQEKSPNEN